MALLNPGSLSAVVSLVAGDRSVGTGFLSSRSLPAQRDQHVIFIVTVRNHNRPDWKGPR